MSALTTGNESFAASKMLCPGIITLQTGFALSVRSPPCPTPEGGAQLGPLCLGAVAVPHWGLGGSTAGTEE